MGGGFDDSIEGRTGPFAAAGRRPAGLAVLIALAVHAILCLQYVTVNGLRLDNLVKRPNVFIRFFWVALPRLAGYIVAVWWLALGLGGSRSADSGATGRLGRLLGWCWIAMAVASEVAVWCYPLNY